MVVVVMGMVLKVVVMAVVLQIVVVVVETAVMPAGTGFGPR